MSNGLYDIYKTSNRMDDIYKASDISGEQAMKDSRWLSDRVIEEKEYDAKIIAKYVEAITRFATKGSDYCSGQLTNQSDHGVYESGNSTLHDVDVLGTSVDHC